MADVELDQETDGWLGLIASGFFFVGMTALVWGDNAQTSLKTVSLLALSQLLGVPLYGSIGAIVWYCLFGVLWMWILLQSTCRSAETSTLKQTYRPDIDRFPHWLGCLLPSAAATFCTYLLVDRGNGLGQCRVGYTDNAMACTYLFLQLIKANIAALAFLPQAYIILYQVWGFEGATLHFKVKIFLSCMFVCYSLWAATWIWQNSDLVLDPNTWGSAVSSQLFFFFLLAHVVTLATIAAPWIYRATCLKCCGTCTPSRSGREGPTPGDATLPVNTGLDNNDIMDLEPDTTKPKAWFASPWSSSDKKDIDKTGEDEDMDMEMTTPAIIGGSSYDYGTPVSSSTLHHRQQQQPTTSDSNADNETPDWLT